MKFDPKSDDDIKREESKFLPLPPGTYDAEIIEAEDKVSAKGNEMIALKMKVYADDGSFRFVRDWLVSTIPAKVKRGAYAFGLAAEYDMGELTAADFNGRPGRVTVKIERDASGTYPDKNTVASYPPPAGGAPSAGARKSAPDDGFGDSIPF